MGKGVDPDKAVPLSVQLDQNASSETDCSGP